MPHGVHGMFPVIWEDSIYIAAGGLEASYSQSNSFYSFNIAGGPALTPPPVIPTEAPTVEADTPPPPPTLNAAGVLVNSYGEEITPSYKEPGHPNDGNEGNEGNEGDEGTL